MTDTRTPAPQDTDEEHDHKLLLGYYAKLVSIRPKLRSVRRQERFAGAEGDFLGHLADMEAVCRLAKKR